MRAQEQGVLEEDLGTAADHAVHEPYGEGPVLVAENVISAEPVAPTG